jgi:hypothetical protein
MSWKLSDRISVTLLRFESFTFRMRMSNVPTVVTEFQQIFLRLSPSQKERIKKKNKKYKERNYEGIQVSSFFGGNC